MRIATWNMDHWKGMGRDREHTRKAWDFVRTLEADVVLLQEAAPPPPGYERNEVEAPRGETLVAIARKLGVKPEEIASY